MTKEHFINGLKDALDAVANMPTHNWYVVGVFLSTGIVGSVVLWLIKYYHRAKSLEKPAKHFLGYVLHLVSSLGAISAYFITNSHDFPVFFGAAEPTIFAIATTVHQFTDSKTFKLVVSLLQNIVGQKNSLKNELETPVAPEVHAANVAANPTDLFQ